MSTGAPILNEFSIAQNEFSYEKSFGVVDVSVDVLMHSQIALTVHKQLVHAHYY